MLQGILLILTFAGLSAQSPYYYYYGGKKQFLELNTKHAFVSASDQNATEILSARKVDFQPLRADRQSRSNQTRYWTVLSLEDRMSDETYLKKLQEIRSARSDVVVAPYFKNRQFENIGLSYYFSVKLKSPEDTVLLRRFAEKEFVCIEYQKDLPLWYLLSVTAQSKYNALEMSNRFYESGLFRNAEPEFRHTLRFACSPTDEFFSDQWALHDSYGINICDAWEISTGKDVIVAVVDYGIEPGHPDLYDNILKGAFSPFPPIGYDCNSGGEGWSLKPDHYHGNSVAGIIGAVKDNGIGIAGVAPECKLMSVKVCIETTTGDIPVDPNLFQKIGEGIKWAAANDAGVINMSWGSLPSTQIADGIEYAVTQGRGGLGTVVVAATGNDNKAPVDFPANLPNVIGVGAITPYGERKRTDDSWGEWGSNYGGGLDVVAPGIDIYTVDNWNNPEEPPKGCNPIDDYCPWFFGTSAATPHVAGIAALILSKYPNLTQAQVRRAIEYSCRKLPNYAYDEYTSNGMWNNETGYGLVDAYAALKTAELINAGVVIDGARMINFTDNPANYTLTGAYTADQWTVEPTAIFDIHYTGNTATVTVKNGGWDQEGLLTAEVNGVKFHKYITSNFYPHIIGNTIVCPTDIFYIEGAEATEWVIYTWEDSDLVISKDFYFTCDAYSATVTAKGLNGQSGTLWAKFANGDSVYLNIYACKPTISGNSSVNYNGNPFSLLHPPSDTIYWTVSNTNIFSVASSGNPTTVTRLGTGTGNAILTARSGSTAGDTIATMTITPCTPVTINETSNTVCNQVTYSISTGVSATWTVPSGFSANTTTGNSITVTATGLNGQSGTLKADVYGVTLTKTITACQLSIYGPERFCSTGTYTISGLPSNFSGSVAWTVKSKKYPNVANYNTLSIQLSIDELWEPDIFNITAVVKDSGGTILNTCTYKAYGGYLSPVVGVLSWSTASGQSGQFGMGNYDKIYLSHWDDEDILYMDSYISNGINYNLTINYSYLGDLSGDHPDCVDQFDAQVYHNPERVYLYSPYDCGGCQGELLANFQDVCGGYSDDFYIPFEVSAPSPSSSSSSSSFSSLAFPNPVSDILHIDIDLYSIEKSNVTGKSQQSPNMDIRLYDGQGVIVRQTFAKDGTIQFNVANLPNGIYYLQIYDGISDKPEMQKIIVQQ